MIRSSRFPQNDRDIFQNAIEQESLAIIRVSLNKLKSEMLDPEDVAGIVLLACTQSPKSRIIEMQMRTMAEALA